MVSKGFDPHPVFAALQRLCSGIPDFSITPRLVVGTFSYAKLPMVADLAAQGDALADHDVVAALAGDPDALQAVRSASTGGRRPTPSPTASTSSSTPTPPSRPPSRRSAPAPTWSSRARPAPASRRPSPTSSPRWPATASGCCSSPRSAPPSTPSLGRLDRLGLGDLVLDAHDGATNRRRLAQEFGATLERASDAADPDTTEVERTLVDRRTRLTDHADGPARACASRGGSARTTPRSPSPG